MTLAFGQELSDARIRRVVTSLRPAVAIKGRPPVRWTLAERMDLHRVPGVSIAIIEGGQIVWAGAFGVNQAGLGDAVTTSTLFQAQSISKPVAATAALALVDAGRLSLDADVNSYLRSWKVPQSLLTSEQRITLRRILSHSAGLTVGGFSGYRFDEPVPTLLEILNGVKPANNQRVLVDKVPGTVARYSGGGMIVMQQLLFDVTGEPFGALVKRLVFDRVGMRLSTFEQPLPKERFRDAAAGHDGTGQMVPGRWPVQPELAAGGLWSTPTELAKWAIDIANAWRGRPATLLSRARATEMLSVQLPPFGLGLYVDGTGTSLNFHHAGSIWGFRARLVMYPAAGKGVVIMTNADGGDSLISELLTSIATEYDWPSRGQRERASVTLSIAQLEGLVGTYALPPAPSGTAVLYVVTRENRQLYAEIRGLGERPKTELHPESVDSFFSINGLPIKFVRDGAGQGQKVILGPIEGVRQR